MIKTAAETMELNIWSCEKDTTVKHLLLLLREDFVDPPYQIENLQDTDEKAVRLINCHDETHSLYIYTYGQDAGNYGVHLEYASQQNRDRNDIAEVFDNLSYERLINLIRVQFC